MAFTEYLIKVAGTNSTHLIKHAFGEKLCNNQLTIQEFKNYLIQDNLYLFDYQKAFALLLVKSRTLAERDFALKCIADFTNSELEMQDELPDFKMPLHAQKSPTCAGYTAWFYEIAQQGDWWDLLVALAPCVIGYYFFSLNLKPLSNTSPIYKKWIDFYQGEASEAGYRAFKSMIDTIQPNDLHPDKLKRLISIFNKGVWWENIFFSQTIYNQ